MNGFIVLSTLALTGLATHWVGPVGGGFGFFFLLIPLFWIIVVGLVIGLGGRRWRRNRAAGPHPGFGGWAAARNAEATLAERFAQGDIDEVEYRARLEVLRANAYRQG